MADWNSAWENNEAEWHREDYHPILQKHLQKITDGRPNAKIFVPLCGKSVDIPFLSKMGHQVIGVEFSELAVSQFFQENNISCSTVPVPEVDGVLYESVENRIKIYCCDFFKFSSNVEEDFDGVWDRGGLEALETEERKKYVDVVKSLCKPNAGYILEIADRPPGVGPPYYMSTDDIVKLFGLVKQLEQIDYEIAPPGLKAQGCDGLFFYYFKMP